METMDPASSIYNIGQSPLTYLALAPSPTTFLHGLETTTIPIVLGLRPHKYWSQKKVHHVFDKRLCSNTNITLNMCSKQQASPSALNCHNMHTKAHFVKHAMSMVVTIKVIIVLVEVASSLSVSLSVSRSENSRTDSTVEPIPAFFWSDCSVGIYVAL
jgi:hypothetical protein